MANNAWYISLTSPLISENHTINNASFQASAHISDVFPSARQAITEDGSVRAMGLTTISLGE